MVFSVADSVDLSGDLRKHASETSQLYSSEAQNAKSEETLRKFGLI